MNFKLVPLILFTSLVLPCFASCPLEEMSLEEKVGQLLMVHFNGEQANDDAKTLIQEAKVGGIIYYNWSNGLHSPEQIRTLSSDLQKLIRSNQNPIPLLIATDQEGGVVARLNHGFTAFPGNKALGETFDPNLAHDAALAMGQEMQAVGVNMNLAPAVDVNSNPRNPVIGVRSFGDQPEIVLAFGEKALSGYKQAQIIATLKHFPGYGDVAVDPHEDLPVIRKSKEELEQVELLPFAKLASSADAMMTAHILVPALDTENCSTLSEKTLNYLRETIGFQGVIVADSLVMEGVVKKCHTVDEAAIQALKAGCDILILGGKLLVGEKTGFELTVADVQRIHSSIIQAIKNGRVSEARLNDAVQKIFNLKNRYLTTGTDESIDLANAVNTAAHHAIAQKIASLALKATKNESNLFTSLHEKRLAVFAPQILQTSIEQTTLLKMGKATDSYFFSSLNPSKNDLETAQQRAEMADILVICSYNAWKNPSQEALIRLLLDVGKPAVLIVTRDPLDSSLFPSADLIFTTFSPTTPSIQAVCDQLTKNQLSCQDANRIGEKIWKNECAGTKEGLTNWNKGENFASLGIGHFIWYPLDKEEQFQETFPALLQFLLKQGVILPEWLKSASGCPWKTRESFYEDIHTPKMDSLRQLLFDTRHLQAVFIANRLQDAFPQIIESCSQEEKEKITTLFHRLLKDADGLYALIDYLNFKGSGTSPKETYKGQGWGLLQVLQGIPLSSNEPLLDFVKVAKAILKQRVYNSPSERHEEQWLNGWSNRLDTYLNLPGNERKI